MTNLGARILAALVLAPTVIAVVLFSSAAVFAAVFAVFVLLAAWEWAGLCGLSGLPARVGYALSVGLCMAAIWFADGIPAVGDAILFLGLVFWVTALIWVSACQRRPLEAGPIRGALPMGFLVLVPAWYALVAIHGAANGPAWVMFLFALVWAADIGAYFVGRRFGRRKLASRVSPGKSVEGVLGALAAVLIFALLVGLAPSYASLHTVVALLVCIITALASILGDLTESLVKRRAGVKDSGTLIPGHGGVLDRIDSITAAAPVFALGVQFMGQLS